MSTERWRQLGELFAEAVDQPAGLRLPFIERRCADAGMRDELAALLHASDVSGDFLATPALDAFARQVSREGWAVQPGDRVAVYTIAARLGAGGMGEVWRARDERLGRDVAIKLLLPHAGDAAERAQAFEREARAAGALNHPNVLTVYDVGEHDGAPYIVTECLEGESLRARLARGPLALDDTVVVAQQVARGLAAAHARGIVHRDLKPENVFLTGDGGAKILDFGIAALASGEALAAGTAGYVAPEQLRGEPVDARADIFAFGAVLREMLPGEHPRTLKAIVRRCLEPSPADRFASVHELIAALDSVARELHPPPPPRLSALLRRPPVMAAVIVTILVAGAGTWWWRATAARVRWVHATAVPEIRRLANLGDFAGAFLIARDALRAVPDDPQLAQLWLEVSAFSSITTEPDGADVFVSTYRTPPAQWIPLGRSPLRDVRMPRGLAALRITKAGFEPIEGTTHPQPDLDFRLDTVGSRPAGMVRVSGGRDPVRFGAVGDVADFWIDRLETTNREFKDFVEAGGYTDRSHWREPFMENGRAIEWEAAMLRFRDRSGRPGPATWMDGTYPEGQADFPVAGVSWYEAAAYARFRDKSLPTMYHWYRAAGLGRFADILTVSTFGTGPTAAGASRGLGPYGTYDMAGNVKEWCWNETATGRFLLGGAWNEPRYMYADYDARGAFERAPNVGFRLATYGRAPTAAELAPVRIFPGSATPPLRPPVSDEIFQVYRRQYAYDPAALQTVVETTETTSLWVRMTVTFDAAYGGERMRAHLFLPRDTRAPFQTVIFFPGYYAFLLPSSRDMALGAAEMIVRSGRAFLYPVYKGTYERHGPDQAGATARRELRIAWSRDLGRAIDYLETRNDIDRDRLAYYGISAGADAGIILTALEPRLKASVLQGTGLWDEPTPEIDARNYAPRITVPTLMVGGRYDFELPYETTQRPLFALLGPAPEHKYHAIVETGHAVPDADLFKTVLPWLDRYLGRVER